MNDVIMVASTIVLIPTSLIVFVAVYLCGLWITAFMLGFNRYSDDSLLIVMISVFWPSFLILIAVFYCVGKLEEIVSREGWDKAKRIVCGVGRCVGIAFLPFRPFALGRAVSDRIANRKSKP